MPLPEIQCVSDAAALAEATAEVIVNAAEEAVRASGRFSIALSGGSTPHGLYTLLATDDRRRAAIAWDKVHVFWGDDRHVAPDHPDSNFRMADEALLSHVPIDPAHIWRMKSEYPDASKAADEYERDLRDAFRLRAGEVPRFDLVLLGIGTDGHTASLFPGTPVLKETKRLVASSWVPRLQTDRITLTVPVLNNTACALFQVEGAEKSAVLKDVLEGPYDPERLPAQLVRPHRGRLIWIVDSSAGSSLSFQNHGAQGL